MTAAYRIVVASLLGAALLVLAAPAHATSGTLVITSSTTLTEDHFGHIVIAADNVTLDCAGHTVLAPDLPGFAGAVNVEPGLSGITVRRCNIVGSSVNGIYTPDVSNSRYEANILQGNANHGIHIDGGSGNSVVGNTVRDNGALGIVFTVVVDSEIRANIVENNVNWAGIALFADSRRISVIGNTARGNAFGFLIESGAGANTVTGNTAQQNILEGFLLTGSAGNALIGNTANNNGAEGIILIDSDENELTGNVANRNGDHESDVFAGIALVSGSSGNLVDQNTTNGNADEGFVIEGSDSNTVTRNVSNTNGQVGFEVRGGSSGNALSRNTARRNGAFDAVDDQSGVGNVWTNNTFGTTQGI